MYLFIIFFQRDRFKPNNCIRKVTLDLKKKNYISIIQQFLGFHLRQ